MLPSSRPCYGRTRQDRVRRVRRRGAEQARGGIGAGRVQERLGRGRKRAGENGNEV